MADESKQATMRAVVPQDGVAAVTERAIPTPGSGQVLRAACVRQEGRNLSSCLARYRC